MIEATAPSLRVWQVDLGNRSDLVFMLRDYLKRLGLEATVSGPASVTATTSERRAEMLAHLAAWETVTGVKAQLPSQPKLLTEVQPSSDRPRLGELLVTKRLISEEQLVLALNEARETGTLLGLLLVNKQLIFEDELARTLSEQLNVPYISLMRIGVNAAAARLMPADEGLRVAAIPVRVEGGEVQVAFADPTDKEALNVVHRYIDNIRIAVSELTDIRMAWRQFGPSTQG